QQTESIHLDPRCRDSILYVGAVQVIASQLRRAPCTVRGAQTSHRRPCSAETAVPIAAGLPAGAGNRSTAWGGSPPKTRSSTTSFTSWPPISSLLLVKAAKRTELVHRREADRPKCHLAGRPQPLCILRVRPDGNAAKP